MKNLHSWQELYMTAGRDGRDQFQVCPCATYTTIKFFPVPGNLSTRKSLEMHLTLRLFTVIQAGFEPHRHILKF